MNTTELLRARFAEVQAEVDSIRNRTAPQREKLRALVDKQAAMQAEIDRLAAEVHAHDGELV